MVLVVGAVQVMVSLREELAFSVEVQELALRQD